MNDKVLISRCREPAWNLALEEYLLNQGKPLLLLWQNEPSVILGRNQNPYRECDPRLLESEGVKLVRRKSGGGAVYHDPGNLNITMVSPRGRDTVEEHFRFLGQVLKNLGLDARISGRNDLEIQGKKISGSAFYETQDMVCHHCTMLIDLDLERMTRYLTPPALKLQSRGIDSVRSRVANLRQWLPALTAENLMEAIGEEAGRKPVEIFPEEIKKSPEIRVLAQVYESFAWTYGECPDYNLSLEEKYRWGHVEARLQIEAGRIRSCSLYTDSLLTDGFRELGEKLRGHRLFGRDCQEVISASGLPPEICRDLTRLLT